MILSASPWWSSAPAVGALLGYLWLAARPASGRLAVALVGLLHAAAIAASLLAARFGFAPALSVTAWLVFALHAVESRVYRPLPGRRLLAGLGAAALLLALVFPGPHRPAPGSAWLPLHWSLGIASYGLLAAAVVHAWMMQRAEASMRRARADAIALPLLALERLTFRLVGAAFALLSATLLAGWWFSDRLHGWNWNHKTVFTVLSWLVLALLLAGRWRRGWRGRLAARMLYAAAALLLLGYVGSRFVLEVILGRA